MTSPNHTCTRRTIPAPEKLFTSFQCIICGKWCDPEHQGWTTIDYNLKDNIPKLSPTVEAIAKRIADNTNISDIAVEFGVHRSTIHRIMKNANSTT